MNRSMKELHQRLESFKGLELGWDSYGARPPPHSGSPERVQGVPGVH